MGQKLIQSTKALATDKQKNQIRPNILISGGMWILGGTYAPYPPPPNSASGLCLRRYGVVCNMTRIESGSVLVADDIFISPVRR